MTIEGISTEVRAFLREHIESVEQLEILLLLHGQKDKEWTAEEVARTLRSSSISAGKRLSEFVAKGILSETKPPPLRYRFNAPETLGRNIASLAEAYQVRRVTVIDLIFSKPSDKLKIFADAFKLREGK